MRSTRAWRLAPWLVRVVVPNGVIGAYLLGEPCQNGDGLAISYVGRSDSDLRRRLLQHCAAYRAGMFRVEICMDVPQAFHAECYLWHATDDCHLTNIIHPAAPHGYRLSCPYCGD